MSQCGESLDIWGVHLLIEPLSDLERGHLVAPLDCLPTNAWELAEMYRVWLELGLDNSKPLACRRAELSCAHPAWLVNGIFPAADPVSAAHRTSIARYILDLNPTRVADSESGFFEFSRRLALTTHHDDIQFFNKEPFPRRADISCLEGHSTIVREDDFSRRTLNVVAAQDVLEHVDDPRSLAVDLWSVVSEGRYAIFISTFTSCILNHITHTFALRHTFQVAMRIVGCKPVGSVPGTDRLGQTLDGRTAA